MSRIAAHIRARLQMASRILHRPTASKGLFGAPASRNCSGLPLLLFTTYCLWNASTTVLAAQCKLAKLIEFPITMVDMRPLMSANINDSNVQFVLDSGAFYSSISPASAAELKLKLEPFPMEYTVRGVNGEINVSVATVKTFTLAGVPLHNIDFLVGGSEVGPGSIGLLGENVLHLGDFEYDLGKGMVRLMKPQDCGKTPLAYWAGASTPYSVIELTPEAPFGEGTPTGSNIRRKSLQLSHIIGRASLNGVPIRVMLDTGAPSSVLSLDAAAHAGIRPNSPGVVNGGAMGGLGRSTIESYIASFPSFKIGEEEIKNARLRFGNIELPEVDMLIGADFFLSHRIYVANSQNKLYFSYNGGPVFNLDTSGHSSGDAATVSASPESGKADAPTEDAADYSRRGAAFASRHEFDQALNALNRACELAPGNADYLYQRALVYWQLHQADQAKADLDQALILKPNSLAALTTRADLLLWRGDKAGAAADLDAADASAPKEANERLEMAYAYERADRFASAVAQATMWIESHPVDQHLPEALNSRCWNRALVGSDLTHALKDCNDALGYAKKSSEFYAAVADSRGFVFLRMGAYDKSIADYDASLKINAKSATSLYGRGLDKLRKQETSAGNADIAQATAISPDVGAEFSKCGIAP